MRVLIRAFDRMIRWASGVFEFCDEEVCLLRLQCSRAPHDLHLSDSTQVRAGDPVLKLHLWNERVPPLGPGGSDLAWAVNVRRRLIRSLRAAAQWLAEQPSRDDVRAIGGATVLVSLGGGAGSLRLMERLSFDVFPYRGPLGRFGEFWENLYTWGLMWTFNAASLRHRSLLRLRRAEVWMSAAELLARYGHPQEACPLIASPPAARRGSARPG
jgi:hypothetical protein